ncbi:hypothetical protein B7494_g6317 [Chlorociboria aeruginascens]|nr:hypothetical protein B7494_g6317 [Chlorociboria aeruginascens]
MSLSMEERVRDEEKVMEGEKVSDEQQLEVQPPASDEYPRRTTGQKIRHHSKRFWWVYVIIIIVCTLVITLPLLYVGFPHIAQNGVNNSKLTLVSLAYLDPTPDTIRISQTVNISSGSRYTPTLSPFNATLYLVTNGTRSKDVLDVLSFPALHATKHAQSTITDQLVQLSNQEQIAEYTTQVLNNVNITTGLHGRPKLYLGKLPTTTVTFDKDVTYLGLNGLAGFNVTDLRVNLSAPAGSPNMVGLTYVPNPSVLTVAMGNVTFDLAGPNGTILGNTTINDFTIAPGNNTLPMTGAIDNTLLLPQLVDGNAVLTVIGRSSVYNGLHLPYYETAIKSNNLTLTLNIPAVLAASGY